MQKYQHYQQVKLRKHEYLTGKEIFPPDQYRLIEQDEFIIHHLEKNLKSK